MTSEQQESSTLVFEAYPKEVLQEAIAEKGIAARTAAEETELPYMGAKTGRVYYPAACTSAQKIKKENRLYFATILEAEAAGRTRSSQCK